MRADPAELLDQRLTEMFAGEESAGEPQPPDDLAQLEPLLHLAKEIRELPRPEPNPMALKATQARVREAARIKQQVGRRGLFSFRLAMRRVSLALGPALVVVLALVVIGLGTVVASADSLPNSPLYPIKRTTERVQLLLAFSPTQRAQLHLHFAERRLHETMRLMSCCQSLDEAALRSMLEETDLAIKVICTLPKPEAEPLVNKALKLTAQQHTCLTQIRDKASSEHWCALDEAIEACRCNEQVLERR